MACRTLLTGTTFALASILTLASCGPSAVGSGDDDTTSDGGNNACSGSATRCVGTQYQTCQNGSYQTADSCTNVCDATRGGCVDCVPGSGNVCNGNNVVACSADGTFGSVVTACPSGTECSGGSCARSCSADGVDLIYLVDDANNLLSFDPRLIGSSGGPYQMIGRLNCPDPGPPLEVPIGVATPFSMAVDRNGVAWVLYSSGKIFKVSTADASCTATSFQVEQNTPPQTWSLFGMGYVTDTPGGETEKLWIGGGNTDGMRPGSLGYIDTDTMMVHFVSPVGPSAEYSAEFTGLGDATLWAFFPDTINNAFVQQIDKGSGAGVGNRRMFDLAATGRAVQAWAFAQWGGKFYVFVTTVDALTGLNPNATVHAIDRDAPNTHQVVLQNQQYVVVGAGVSTCAPVTIGRTTP